MTGEHERAALEAVAREIAGYTRPSAPPALRMRVRASLLASHLVRPPSRIGGRLANAGPAMAGLLLLALIAVASGSATAASLPGDPAFALKRVVEEMQVAISSGDAARLDALMTQADRRLRDLEAITETRPDALAMALSQYESAIDRVDGALAKTLAQDPGSVRDEAIARVAAERARHIATLHVLAARLPVRARPGIERAIETQQRMQGKPDGVPGPDQAPGDVRNGRDGDPGTLGRR